MIQSNCSQITVYCDIYHLQNHLSLTPTLPLLCAPPLSLSVLQSCIQLYFPEIGNHSFFQDRPLHQGRWKKKRGSVSCATSLCDTDTCKHPMMHAYMEIHSHTVHIKKKTQMHRKVGSNEVLKEYLRGEKMHSSQLLQYSNILKVL